MISPKATIHPTAIIEPGAIIHDNVTIGAYSVIGPNVVLGAGTIVGSHASIKGYTTLGEENQIFSYASIGEIPQDLKYKGEKTFLIIGHKNIFREFVTVQPGTIQDQSETVIGNGNLFMNYVHIAHDCRIGNQNIFANQAQLAGHVMIANKAIIAGFSGFHQHVRVGEMAMAAAGALVTKDIPPYCMAAGSERAKLTSLNLVALKRHGIPANVRDAIKKAYKIFFLSNHETIEKAISAIEKESLLEISEVANFVNFIKDSKRGVLRPDVKLSLTNEASEKLHD